MMTVSLSIRQFKETDIPALLHLTLTGAHQTEPDYFETALKEQQDGKRVVLLAFVGENLAGYVHLNFFPQYSPFLRLDIPEIQDLFVHPDARRQGIGEHLITSCEGAAKEKGSDDIGIGVGLTNGFGAAQRLYVRMGYVPDGAGIVFERVPVSIGELRPIDDRLCLMLFKSL